MEELATDKFVILACLEERQLQQIKKPLRKLVIVGIAHI